MTKKYAALSPAINQMEQPVNPEDQAALFEDKFGQMAYQVFNAKFPDLVGLIVTFKVLDADIDKGSGVGTFVMEEQGELFYVPVILADNQLKPFDIVYVKSKDIFLPLSPEWIDEVRRGGLASLGESAKLPNTVATDVDIRNIVVPPTTGRYSYASAQDAEATEPLGRKLQKLAEGLGGTGVSSFDPTQWKAFVGMFQQTQGITPGKALDSGAIDIDALGKMYKSHLKAWGTPIGGVNQMANQAQQQPVQQSGGPTMPMAPMPQPPAPQSGMLRTASVGEAVGKGIDHLIDPMIRGTVGGGALGGVYGLAAGRPEDVPGSMLRGAVGGAVGAPIGSGLGRAFGARNLTSITPETSARIGETAGMVTGALGAAPGKQQALQQLMGGGSPEYQYIEVPPEMLQTRIASDLKALLGKLTKVSSHELQLLDFLATAPNQVKEAFVKVIERSPALLKSAADLYGAQALVDALTPKTAGQVSTSGALYIADDKSKAPELTQMFGDAAPEAFRGVLMRGYHFKDTRPKLKLAVKVQEYHDFHDAKESGVYLLRKLDGSAVPAFVVSQLIDLMNEDRAFFPANSEKVMRVKNKVPRHSDAEDGWLGPDVERSHKEERMAVLENGDYLLADKLLGEQCTELLMKGSDIHRRLMTDKRSAPSGGLGFFAVRRGMHYLATKPVEVSDVTTDSNGVMKGKVSYAGGFGGKRFVMDPRSPINRIVRPKDENYVVIPASWKWVPLKSKLSSHDFISSAKLLSTLVLDHLGSMGGHEAVAVRVGESIYSVDGGPTFDKVSAMREIATQHQIHVSAAEAMLKIADHEGVCRAIIGTPEAVRKVSSFVKTAQGMEAPSTPMGGPPAMTGGSSIDQAFQQTVQELQQQMDNVQAQLNVLQTVQQRAQQLDSGAPPTPPQDAVSAPPPDAGGAPPPDAGAAPPPPDAVGSPMQGSPPGMTPDMGSDPSAPQDPSGMAGPAIMHSESPSSTEIAQQVNPAFLEQASQLSDLGAFDAGAIGSLAKDPSLREMGSQYAANLESSLDDVGRTLLTLYMQEGQLKERMGDAEFTKLETQLRDTFQGMGELLLNLTQHTSMMHNVKDQQPEA